jgi:hypothetical protein
VTYTDHDEGLGSVARMEWIKMHAQNFASRQVATWGTVKEMES